MQQLRTLQALIEQALPPDAPTRREFMALSGSLLGGAWLMGLATGCDSAASHAAVSLAEGGDFATLTQTEALDFEAFSALIIPTDDTPGAREAGVVYFVDNALGSFFELMLPAIRPGLADLTDRANEVDSEAGGFAGLSERQQLRIMRTVEQEEPAFFGTARFLIMIGFSSHPSYGGNRDRVGWEVMGFEEEFQYSPPFGAYDRDVHEGGAS